MRLSPAPSSSTSLAIVHLLFRTTTFLLTFHAQAGAAQDLQKLNIQNASVQQLHAQQPFRDPVRVQKQPTRTNTASPNQLPSADLLALDNLQPLLDDDFDDWLAKLADVWSIKGLSIAVVRKRNVTKSNSEMREDDWVVETKGYGIKNAAKDPVTEDVSL